MALDISLFLLGLDVSPPPSGGGGGGSYTAQAIHADGTALLANDAIVATNNQFWSFSYWFKNITASPGPATLLAVDPAGTYGVNIDIRDLGLGGGVMSPSWDTSDGPGTNYTEGRYYTNMDGSAWHHHLFCIDTNHPNGEKIIASYVDGVREPAAAWTDTAASSPDGAYTMSFNGLRVTILGDGLIPGSYSPIGDFADIWCAFGVSLLDGSGDIPEATRLKFRDANGKPVNLGTDGSTPTGAAPAIFFSGDHTAFATNQGTCGAFTLTGSLTNASTSPSD